MDSHLNRRLALAAALSVALPLSALPLAAQAQTASAAYPTKSITMVVPFPPGGLADLVARPVAEAMSRDLGQPVVIENKGGAGGGIGMAQVAKATADGYTILMALSSYSVIPEADTILGRAQMYSFASLRPIARFTADPTVLAVRAESPWKSVKDFVDDAKKRPGAINYGSSGNYGTMHVPMEILAQNAGIKMTHVPFTGAGPAVVALLGGQIDAVSSGPATVLQHVKAGKLRVLAHWGSAKLDALPDVPSLKDAGFNAEYAQWSGLFIPAATPEPVAQRLRAAARVAANDDKVKQVILNAGSPVLYQDTPDFEKYVQGDVRRMSDVVKKIGKVE
ncbi:tripartite tricarboxylate transporter substrate binding protein [Caenimonas koreensis]|uniref:Tripartite tricarboxylate transporter substrate binding protein n=1 Tax=Caenimonas koreensis DSM 17982 TaxID=1121255 RepID=A0A844BB98_9BURK|nr:tripartite tricarboxylate transporter substrate binding protein [Caenimonas koreensis]MRD48836.1 tripartite tricarboxylate transporter substrate binding protein [Caenimonas koreensis DSM 17982]